MSDKQLQNVLVIGMGVSGKAVADFLLASGINVAAVDDRQSLLEASPDLKSYLERGLRFIAGSTPFTKDDFTFVIVSPGIPRTHSAYKRALELKIEVLGEVEFAIRQLKERNYRYIGITGTNGKTTVTLLLEHLLQKNHVPAIACGNVGLPITDLLSEKNAPAEGSTLILELSSFQLETLQSQFLDVAVLLNIAEDHLDRYDSFEEYAKTKARMFRCVKANAPCYVEDSCHRKFHSLWADIPVQIYPEPAERLSAKFGSLEGHDLENMWAAYGVVRELGLSSDAIIHALDSFKKPAHRLEFVAEISEVNYVNDSKATNVDAVLRAVEMIKKPILLIAGGVDKGGSYAPWRSAFPGKVRVVLLIGQAAECIAKALSECILLKIFASLEEAFIHANEMALPGETILLSPGCASYDMFINYEHRGNRFKELVYRTEFQK